MLAMIRPFAHPKTGTFWVRKTVPVALRPLVGRRELTASLRTKDVREAKAAAGPVIARFEALIASARAGGSRLSQREIDALCGAWYRAECEAHGDDPGRAADWDLYDSLLGDRVVDLEDPVDDATVSFNDRLKLKPEDLKEARDLLEAHGHAADAATVQRLAKALFPTKRDFAGEMKRRAEGDWSPDPILHKFPPVVAPTAPDRPMPAPLQAPPKATVAALIAGWAAEAGTTGKALYDRERTGKMLTDFLGHGDAGRVTADDVVRWKENRLAAGRCAKTVANDIGELRPIWTWGKANRKVAFDQNPFSGLAPRTKKHARRARGPFTGEEARRILLAARGESSALLRWLPWVLCFTGARLGEVTQAIKKDVRREGADGPWVLSIHEDGDGRTLKTVHSERLVPLHSALIGEGFVRYVEALRAGSSLFPAIRPDKFGTRKGTATKAHGRWIRKTVGITDRLKDPAHGWRHHFEDAARRAGLPQAVTDGLLGHLNAQNESEGYGRGYRYMPDVTAPWVAKMVSPLAGETAAPEAPVRAA